jgi:EAL domain-containing protein (putative c-di-GMP-specific phosphodiesterase class I)
VVGSVIHLGHALGLTVVAEGVEHEAQLACLRSLGCDVAQGFHLGYPVDAEEVISVGRPRSTRIRGIASTA